MLTDILLGATLLAILLIGSFILMALGDTLAALARIEKQQRQVLNELDIDDEDA